ncbi:unnamed protein product [Mytilus coruscus]|uniref:Uncharacterized protein n=1 Tax=Mytilus coruscus TaxID=42192 RepID=A0A6J8CW10_MYTCO|nr:unnamed protein product [Mytilus coruscus]
MSSENSLKIQVSDGIPLGTTISQEIKEKIWSDEFIDINSLASSYVEDPFSLFISNRKFSLYNTSRSNKRPMSIEQWTSAFFVFSDIYIEKCPEEARHLLQYGHNIREMYDLYGNETWRICDEKFRRLRETIKLPWGKLIDELYNQPILVIPKTRIFVPNQQDKTKLFKTKAIHNTTAKTCIQTVSKPASCLTED